MRGNWESPQGAPVMIPPTSIGHGCSIPTNMACDDPCTLPMAKPIRIFQFVGIYTSFLISFYKHFPKEFHHRYIF